MSRAFLIALAIAATLLLVGAASLYAYDSSNDDQIAGGITVGGVPLGGLSSDEARVKLQREVARPLEEPVRVTYQDRTFELSAREAGVRADVGGMVGEALERSRDGSFIGRGLRDLTGGEETARIKGRVSHSASASRKLAARIAKEVDRPAQDAKVNFPSLTKVAEKSGLKVDAERLRARVDAALVDPDERTVRVPVNVTEPKVTRDQLEEKYPAVIVIDRDAFQLRFYRNLRLAKTYRIAVGQVGLETPAGLYHIQNKAVNAAWSVPNSAWAGSLAGQVIPGGAPNNPLKARWMGIFDGAGIHGTDQVGSLGTAASHGCVRMAIPDVIELYNQVKVQTPVYIA
jgi:lipoprotein-anchoring transpeptidase ErfK/SrfK